ncbi:MAG TPA: prepilin-type N-terminal cleavage/methylation domain-containing protein [Patescibacteria group bacterium]|nr:prepilin-type N-terminal cleavage/methylation domain-containing protein [Patescibacteria group bacterium]
MSKTINNQKGFTFLELLLSIALIALISAFTIPIFQHFQVRNDLDIATQNIVQTMRRAQILAQTMKDDDTWGVAIENGSITLFKGEESGSDFDEVFDMPTSITPSGLTTVIFSKATGYPNSHGTLVLTTSTETKNIIINEKGFFEY